MGLGIDNFWRGCLKDLKRSVKVVEVVKKYEKEVEESVGVLEDVEFWKDLEDVDDTKNVEDEDWMKEFEDLEDVDITKN